MQIAMVGLGRMGANLVRRLLRGGHQCVVYDLDADARDKLVREGAVAASDLIELVRMLEPPRLVWIMVPAGAATGSAIETLASLLSAGDILIDGGNSHFKHTASRAATLAAAGIELLDVGTSGGVAGLDRGYCLMIGGSARAADYCAPIWSTLAPGQGAASRTMARANSSIGSPAEQGWLYCGPSGAGHFVKMIHNGIEYGMMQSLAEGFALLASASKESLPAARRYDLDCAAIAELWRRGSVVTSWLLDLVADALAEDPSLDGYSAEVQDSGEGRWTVECAIEQSVPAHALTAALFSRFRSRQHEGYAEKLLSAMRYKFGGHTPPARSSS